MIKTLVNVTCAEQGKALPYTGKVVGKILGVNNNYTGELIGVNYAYEKEDGTLLVGGVKVITHTEADANYEQIKPELTPNLPYSEAQSEIFYTAFKVEMADTFGILVAEIENI